jgi:hypothetical protein
VIITLQGRACPVFAIFIKHALHAVSLLPAVCDLYRDNADVLPSAESQNTLSASSNFTSSHWIKPSHDQYELNAGETTKTWDSKARHKSSSNEELQPYTNN